MWCTKRLGRQRGSLRFVCELAVMAGRTTRPSVSADRDQGRRDPHIAIAVHVPLL
jgi:hypothetical protein